MTRYEVYTLPNGKWSWRLQSRNGRVVAVPEDPGFASKEDCMNNIKLVKGSSDDEVVDLSSKSSGS